MASHQPTGEPTDAELVARVKAGDRDAAGMLCRRHSGLIGMVITSFGRLPSNVEKRDLSQAGFLALHKAALNYNPIHGIKFSTYASHTITNELIDELNAARRRQLPEADIVATDPLLSQIPDTDTLPPDITHIIQAAKLTPKELEFVNLFWGLSRPQNFAKNPKVMDVAAEMGVPFHEARDLKRNALAKMQQLTPPTPDPG